ncbi:13228_t:CDS:1, partial [Racocetra persica]
SRSTEWTVYFTQNQTRPSLLNIYNEINTLQQYNAKPVKRNKHSISLASG